MCIAQWGDIGFVSAEVSRREPPIRDSSRIRAVWFQF